MRRPARGGGGGTRRGRRHRGGGGLCDARTLFALRQDAALRRYARGAQAETRRRGDDRPESAGRGQRAGEAQGRRYRGEERRT